MTRLVRLIAIVLALAVSAVPLAADWCALSCEAGHDTSAAAPACHHAGTATAHVEQPAAPCDHDHHPILVDAATTTNAAPRVMTPAAAPVAGLGVAVQPVASRRRTVERTAASPPLPLTLAASLRI